MNKIKIGAINGKNIYIGNPSQIRDGEYYIAMNANRPSGLFVKSGGRLVPLCNCNKEQPVEKEQNFQEINILSNLHGKLETIVPSEGYDGISKVSYKQPKIEEKDTVTITKNGIKEIKVGKNYDGMSDVTIIVNVEN